MPSPNQTQSFGTPNVQNYTKQQNIFGLFLLFLPRFGVVGASKLTQTRQAEA